MKKLLIIVAISFVVFFSGCNEKDEYIIRGTAYSSCNTPSQNAEIELYEGNTLLCKAITDENGDFAFSYRSFGSKNVDIQSQGITIPYFGDYYYDVNVYFTPQVTIQLDLSNIATQEDTVYYRYSIDNVVRKKSIPANRIIIDEVPIMPYIASTSDYHNYDNNYHLYVDWGYSDNQFIYHRDFGNMYLECGKAVYIIL